MMSMEWKRVVIRDVDPEVEFGRFPIKRIVGDEVIVEAAIFADGHDALSCFLRYRREDEGRWRETEMQALYNDRWRGAFKVEDLGRYRYTLIGWVDEYRTWRHDLDKRIAAGQDISPYMSAGIEQIRAAAKRAQSSDAARLRDAASAISNNSDVGAVTAALNPEIEALMVRYADRTTATTYRELGVVVDRERARFSTWYEMFPRSCALEPGRHGTFKDCERLIPEIAGMGFDILYFPPIHPIGEAHRKGRNNSPIAAAGDSGSPWGIGGSEGGHKAIHPQLGTLEDFRGLLGVAKNHGVEIALDIAYQCSPDHPYVREHPEWFRRRADGTIQYAENPPKKYEDIYPFNMQCEEWKSLWTELKSVIEFWIEQGVSVFRIDNPHTKLFPFWEWMITDLKQRRPDLIFLAEAFTRPNIMYWLAKLGFTQSYTYFTWRNTKSELTEYFTELTETGVREYFRPNLWPNTPDILHEYLQHGGRPAFMTRLILAGTLAANYGIYGPAYELSENAPREAGSEEYLDSEKYEIKHRNLTDPRSLRPLITRVNAIRRENPALQSNERLRFHDIDNDQLVCYSKTTANRDNAIIVAVNLDYTNTQSGFVTLPLEELGIDPRKPYRITDLLTYASFRWQGPRNYIELRPHEMPAHILKVG
jgi:starch synthase (maltosyl-transferring)